jgi:hypothetical protein
LPTELIKEIPYKFTMDALEKEDEESLRHLFRYQFVKENVKLTYQKLW